VLPALQRTERDVGIERGSHERSRQSKSAPHVLPGDTTMADTPPLAWYGRKEDPAGVVAAGWGLSKECETSHEVKGVRTCWSPPGERGEIGDP